MAESLYHEDFYTGGTWVEEPLGVYVGWVARRGSFCEKMPVRSERNDVVLVFSGEEFPEPGTVQQLKKRDHEFDPSDCSYLVHIYEEDRSFPVRLNGRFHGLLIDRNLRTALLFNDRYGMHRIYYHEARNGFYFATEAKAILAVCPELRRIDRRGLGEFISCGCVLQNRTLFEGMEVLPPASAWVFRNGALEQKHSYFEPREWEDQEPLPAESYYSELRQVFTRNLPRYFRGQEQIGMSLTGGLDTRMIMAWQDAAAGSLPCYTFGGVLRECQDVMVARRVAQACKQTHQVIPVREDFLSAFPRYAERAVYLSDGCLDLSHTPDLYLNERAREIAPVRMTGNYGGEILRRVRAFKAEEPLSGLFAPEIVSSIQEAQRTYAFVIDAHPVSFAVFRQGPWYHYGILALEETQLSMRSPFLDNDIVRAVFRAPESALAGNHIALRLIADGNRALLNIATDRGVAGARSRPLEVVSRGVLEFLFKAEYAYDMGMPQWMARIDHALSPLRIERIFLGRHKIFHFRTGYRDFLARYVREMLLDGLSLSRPYIERRKVQSVVAGHLEKGRNYTDELHRLLALELVHRMLLDSKRPLTGLERVVHSTQAKA
jgi:asparagine synthase (glutamine-hydrolysing)